MYYIRVDDGKFGFVKSNIHTILDSDIAIKLEDYNSFLYLQERGKQFRLKEIPSGTELFDYIEEYIPIPEELGIQIPSDKERISALENLIMEVLENV